MEIKERVRNVLAEELKPKLQQIDDDKQYTVSEVLDMGVILTKDYEPAGRARLYQMIRRDQLSFQDVSAENNSRTEYLIDGDVLKKELAFIYNL